MTISSISFIIFTLPFFMAIYYLCGDKIKPFALALMSIAFYSFGALRYLGLFIGLLTFNVVIGRGLDALHSQKKIRKALFIFGVAADAGVLVFFKYIDQIMSALQTGQDSTAATLVFPLGLSFLTFKEISYLIDVYTGKIKLDSSVGQDLVYLSFFGQITSGPISRYDDTQYISDKNTRRALIREGIYRFVIGFSKKTLIADILTKITAEIFAGDYAGVTPGYAWLGSLCWSLELYFDFAGYSDMAIGLSNIFGYKCPENFIYPYTTESISKFWRKWHVTLGSWFRDYIYIPLGGSRTDKKWKIYRNLLVVWLLTGFWHGTTMNYIAWGIGYFLLISFERMTGFPDKFKTRISKGVYRVVVLVEINFLWVLFRCSDLSSGIRYISKMFGIGTYDPVYDIRLSRLMSSYLVIILAAVIFSMPIMPYIEKKIQDTKAGKIVLSFKPLVLFAMFIISLSFVVSGLNNPFAYANF